jgi:hypothetical protein
MYLWTIRKDFAGGKMIRDAAECMKMHFAASPLILIDVFKQGVVSKSGIFLSF